MTRRRLTWIIHNAMIVPVLPIRILLFGIWKIGCAAEWLGMRTPGMRRYNGWSGW